MVQERQALRGVSWRPWRWKVHLCIHGCLARKQTSQQCSPRLTAHSQSSWSHVTSSAVSRVFLHRHPSSSSISQSTALFFIATHRRYQLRCQPRFSTSPPIVAFNFAVTRVFPYHHPSSASISRSMSFFLSSYIIDMCFLNHRYNMFS